MGDTKERLTLSDAHNWAEFRVGDLFTQERGKEKAPNQNLDGDVPMINETSSNNGFTRNVVPTKVFKGNAITVSINFARVVFYQPVDFCASVNIAILRNEHLNRYNGLYIANVLSYANRKYNYGAKTSKDRLNDTMLYIPATPDGLPDYDFMENYIKQLYDDFADRVCVYTEPVEKNTDISLSDREWKEFKVGELFTFTRGKRVNKRDTEQNQGKIPLVSGGDENNAVMTYINDALASGLRLKNSCISVASYGSSGSVHYHGYKCCIHDNALALNLKNTQHDNPYVNLFMVAILKTLKKNYAYGRPVIADRYSEEIISLPVTTDGQPDYDFMEQYIKSLPFSKALEI